MSGRKCFSKKEFTEIKAYFYDLWEPLENVDVQTIYYTSSFYSYSLKWGLNIFVALLPKFKTSKNLKP